MSGADCNPGHEPRSVAASIFNIRHGIHLIYTQFTYDESVLKNAKATEAVE